MLPIVWERNRGGSCLAAGCAVVGMLSMFLLLTYYSQVVLEYSPVKAGLAFLPLTLAVAASAFGIASPLLPRVPPRMLMVPGLLVAASGLLVLTRLQAGGGYLIHMLPAEVLLGAGLGCVITPAFGVATQGVDRRDTGVAAATVNTAQRVGGSLGSRCSTRSPPARPPATWPHRGPAPPARWPAPWYTATPRPPLGAPPSCWPPRSWPRC